MKSVTVEASKEQPQTIQPGQLISDTGMSGRPSQGLVLLVLEVLESKQYKCMAIKCPPYQFGYVNVWSGPAWLPFSGKVTLEQ
jgi:hypothetical protein